MLPLACVLRAGTLVAKTLVTAVQSPFAVQGNPNMLVSLDVFSLQVGTGVHRLLSSRQPQAPASVLTRFCRSPGLGQGLRCSGGMGR